MGELIKAVGLDKKYTIKKKEIEVLKSASLTVDKGDTVAIIGLSGAGKSTLMHILGGLDRPDSGSVSISGEDLYSASESRRTAIRSKIIGFVFQSYHLMTEMDVMENVMLPAMAGRVSGMTGTALRSRAMSLLESVGLKDRCNHTPLELSGGEQQRVAIARALMNEPAIILADEPTGNLDEQTGGGVMSILQDLVKQKGATLVMVTHSDKIAASCKKIYRLGAGLIQRT